MSDLANRLAATLRHLPTDAAPHRRLEIAAMTVRTSRDHVTALIDRLEEARNQARHFGIDDADKSDDIDRAIAMRRRVREAGDYPIACLATALDELPDLSREAQATLAALMTELDAARLLAPSRDWWAGVSRIVGRSCVTLPDALVAVREAMARKDAEIARLRASASTVGALLATAPEGSIVEWKDDDEWQRVDKRIGPGYVEWWWTYDGGRWVPDDGYMLLFALGLPARLVPADQADVDPATRGPIEVKP